MQTPERDRRQWRTSSLTCTLPQTHATRRAFESTNVATGCNCGSPGHLSSRFPFLSGLSGRPVTGYPGSFVRIVSDGYTGAMGIALRKGRDFSPRDTPASKPVIIVNESLAHRLWPGENPIGKVIVGDCAKEREVVGVVGDVRHMALEKGSGFEMYIPIRQCEDYGSVDVVVRSTLPLAVLASRVETSLRPIAPDLPKGGMRPLTLLVDLAVSPRRFIVLLLGGFAIFALVLASLGIYGVISYRSIGGRKR